MDPHTAETVDIHHSLATPVDLEAPAPLSAEEIRSRAGHRTGVIDVPLLGGHVAIRTPTMAELAKIAETAQGDQFEATIQTIILCCPALSPEDAGWLRDANGLAVAQWAQKIEEFGVSAPVDVEKTAATFRPAAESPVRVDPGSRPGDDPPRVDG